MGDDAMPLLIVGVLLLAAKVAEFGPFATWSWWIVAAPFAITAVWWQFADSSGLTRRRAMARMDEKKRKRRVRALEALGLDPGRQQQVGGTRERAAGRPNGTSGTNGTNAPKVSADPTQAHGSTAPQRRDPRL